MSSRCLEPKSIYASADTGASTSCPVLKLPPMLPDTHDGDKAQAAAQSRLPSLRQVVRTEVPQPPLPHQHSQALPTGESHPAPTGQSSHGIRRHGSGEATHEVQGAIFMPPPSQRTPTSAPARRMTKDKGKVESKNRDSDNTTLRPLAPKPTDLLLFRKVPGRPYVYETIGEGSPEPDRERDTGHREYEGKMFVFLGAEGMQEMSVEEVHGRRGS